MADSLRAHFAVDLVPRLVAALGADYVLAAATAHLRKLTAVLLSLLRPVRLPHRAEAIARLLDLGLGLCRVQGVRAKHLHAVPMAGPSRPDELVRLAWLLPPAKATHVPRLREAMLSRRPVDGRQACLCRAQPVMAIRLTRALVWPPVPRDQFYLADQA